jgi:hypothetical protein
VGGRDLQKFIKVLKLNKIKTIKEKSIGRGTFQFSRLISTKLQIVLRGEVRVAVIDHTT